MALAEQLGTFTTLVGGPEYVHCLLVSLEAGEGPCLPLGQTAPSQSSALAVGLFSFPETEAFLCLSLC